MYNWDHETDAEWQDMIIDDKDTQDIIIEKKNEYHS